MNNKYVLLLSLLVSCVANAKELTINIDTYAGSRNSSGGIGGGFKGSCAVLERCVNTLGKDVDAWLKKQTI